MILENNKRELQKSNNFKSQTFGIKNVGKIFKILVDGIYKDSYGSIVREIVSNAVDANNENKSKKNVIVKIIDENVITGNEETLVIKDFGKGMSKEIMFDVFCNLGESTKEHDNTQIGGFGIGAKSPFKYTDSFTVKTIFENFEYLYNLNLNEEGVAEANLIYSIGTTEDSGTEIQIPIKNNDKFKFLNAINTQLFYFQNIDYSNVKVEHANIIEIGEHYTLTLNNPLDGLNLKLGNVLYTIDFDILEEVEYYTKKFNITLNFNIGEIYPVASRESIDYSQNTINKIINKIESAKQEYTKKLIENINNENRILHYLKLFDSFERDRFVIKKQATDIEIKIIDNYSKLKEYFYFYKLVCDKTKKGYKIQPKSIDNLYNFNLTNTKYYLKTESFKTSKNHYLYDTFSSTNIYIIEPKLFDICGIEDLDVETKRLEIQNNLINHFKIEYNCENYDEIIVPVKVVEKTSMVKKIKIINEVSYKQFYYNSVFYSINAYTFTNKTNTIDNINLTNNIYSFIDEKQDFIEFIAMFKVKHFNSNKINFIRVSKENEKLIKGIHYKKLLKQEMTIIELKDILTASYIYNNLEYKYLIGLSHLDNINNNIFDKYIKLKSYIESNKYNSYRSLTEDLIKTTILLALNNNLLNNDYINLFNELVEYNQDIKLLSYINSNSIENDLIINFLKNYNKINNIELISNQLQITF